MEASGLKFEDESKVLAAKKDLLDVKNLGGWLLIGYTGPTTLALQATGKGGVDEVVSHLKDDQVQYILIRLEELSKDILSRSDGKKHTKDVFIGWTGPAVRTIEKGKKASHMGTVAKFMQPFHAELTAVSKERFNLETVRSRSAPLSGSHVID